MAPTDYGAVVACMSRLKCFAKYGYAALIVVGVVYQIVYVWPAWPVKANMLISGTAVAFFYWFLGGYGLLRVLWASARRDVSQSNRAIAAVLVAVAAWDVASPFVLRDLHPLSVGFHVVGGAIALVVAAIEFYEDPELRGEKMARRRLADVG